MYHTEEEDRTWEKDQAHHMCLPPSPHISLEKANWRKGQTWKRFVDNCLFLKIILVYKRKLNSRKTVQNAFSNKGQFSEIKKDIWSLYLHSKILSPTFNSLSQAIFGAILEYFSWLSRQCWQFWRLEKILILERGMVSTSPRPILRKLENLGENHPFQFNFHLTRWP